MQSNLKSWGVDTDYLNEVLRENPALRGMLFGYLAEYKLRDTWFNAPPAINAFKQKDLDHVDLMVSYFGVTHTIECKSIQTRTIKFDKETQTWNAFAQCDSSDHRNLVMKNGDTLRSSCLLRGEFDILAVNLFNIFNEWKFIFARNQDLPKPKAKKYSLYRDELISTSIEVSWPPKFPFYDNPFDLMKGVL